MDTERNDIPHNEGWLDDVLGAAPEHNEIGPDEHAVASAGLIHPDDMELEQILAEHRVAEAAEDYLENLYTQDPREDYVQHPEDALENYPDDGSVFPESGDTAAYYDTAADEPTRSFTPPVYEEETAVYTDAALPEILDDEYIEPSEDWEDEEEPEEILPKGRPKRKKGYGLFGLPHLVSTAIWLALILIIGISLGRTLWLCCSDLMAFGKPEAEATITIADDDTIESIAEKLSDANLIRYPGLFIKFAELTGKYDNISAGTFTLSSKLDYNAMINGMNYYGAGREEVTVTFPEGYTCAQIFTLLEENNVCTVEELEEYAANGELEEYWFLEGVERGHKYCLEGYLFPDTYAFYTNDEPGRVLEKFLDAFDMRFTDIMRERLLTINERFVEMLKDEGHSDEYIDAHPITIREIVIIASLIEKESAGAEESYIISSVIYNRLAESSQPPYLNIDAALIYGLGGKIDPVTGDSIPLTQADLETDNPYNTYLYTGLTPGPISNPGQNSLDAALIPEDTDYLYYALDPSTGEHEFFKTYQSHLNFLDSLED